MPNQLPKRTRVLVKDLLFKEKYMLTDTQLDIMAYIFNALIWSKKIGGYLILVNKKILSDLPQIGSKTLEASLKVLRDRGLIETRLISVPDWSYAQCRGILITPQGMEYNNSLYTPSQKSIVSLYENRIKDLNKLLEDSIGREFLLEKRLQEIEEQSIITPKQQDVIEPKKEPISEVKVEILKPNSLKRNVKTGKIQLIVDERKM